MPPCCTLILARWAAVNWNFSLSLKKYLSIHLCKHTVHAHAHVAITQDTGHKGSVHDGQRRVPSVKRVDGIEGRRKPPGCDWALHRKMENVSALCGLIPVECFVKMFGCSAAPGITIVRGTKSAFVWGLFRLPLSSGHLHRAGIP